MLTSLKTNHIYTTSFSPRDNIKLTLIFNPGPYKFSCHNIIFVVEFLIYIYLSFVDSDLDMFSIKKSQLGLCQESKEVIQ